MELQLTEIEELFCQEYLIDLNGTQAYIRVFEQDNYNSARVQASKLLAKVNIRTRIKELMNARSEQTLIDAEFVVTNLLEVYNQCKKGEPVMVWDYEAKEMKPTGEWQFDSNGANKSLELLGKHVGMFNEKLQLSGNLGANLNQDQYQQLLQAAKGNA